LAAAVFGDDLSETARASLAARQASTGSKVGFLLGSPEFQRR
jgi:hypothetical protein